jgi:hypothetical protein
MPDNKDKLKELHGNLIKDNYDLPKYEVFEKDMSDIKKLSELRDNLIKDNYDLPDINTFKRDMGFGVDFKAPKYEEKIEKPKSTSIFGEMPGPTMAVSESTKGQNLKQQELIAQEVSEAPERRKKAVDTTLGMWANQNNLDINSPKAQKQRSIYEQGIDSKEFSVSYGQKGLQLVRNVGAADIYLSALKQSNDIPEEYDNVKKMSNEEAARYYENKAQTEEVTPARGTGTFGAPAEFAGSVTRMLSKQSLGSLLATGTALALSPETGGGSLALLGMFGGITAITPDMMKQSYLYEFERRYQQGKSQGIPYQEAIALARVQAERAEKIGFAEAVGFGIGGKAVGTIFSKPVSGIGVKNAVKNMIKTTAPEIVSAIGVSSGSSVAKDLSARQVGFNVSNKEIAENAIDASTEAIKFMGTLAMVHAAQNKIIKLNKSVVSQFKNYVNAADPGVPETVLDNLVINKVIEPEAAEKTKQALKNTKEATAVLEPLKIEDEYILGSLSGKQEKKIKLQNEIKQLKENNVSIGIKEKEAEIAKIDEEMSNINETGDVEANEIDKELPPFEPAVEPAIVESIIEKDEQGNFIPKKYTLNKVGENPAPIISASAIKDESFGGEKPTDIKQVRLLEIRGRNSDGVTVGKVFIQLETGESYNAEVFFNDAELVTLEGIKTPVEKINQPIIQEVKTVEQLRADEQAELDSKIPNAEQYRVDGKVDKTKLTNEQDIKAFEEVYDKYDKLITPLLEKETQIKDANIDALNETIKGTKYENDARSAGLREQVAEGVTGEVPRTTEVTVTETADIAKYKPEQQQFIKETREKLGGEEQSRQLYEKEGVKKWGETYEEFILRKGCE